MNMQYTAPTTPSRLSMNFMCGSDNVLHVNPRYDERVSTGGLCVLLIATNFLTVTIGFSNSSYSIGNKNFFTIGLGVRERLRVRFTSVPDLLVGYQ